MALTLTLPASESIGRPEYPNAYARLLFFMVYANEAFIHINWYVDEDARRRGDDPIHQECRILTPSDLSGDIFPLGYAYLKTLPEFAGAVDV